MISIIRSNLLLVATVASKKLPLPPRHRRLRTLMWRTALLLQNHKRLSTKTIKTDVWQSRSCHFRREQRPESTSRISIPWRCETANYARRRGATRRNAMQDGTIALHRIASHGMAWHGMAWHGSRWIEYTTTTNDIDKQTKNKIDLRRWEKENQNYYYTTIIAHPRSLLILDSSDDAWTIQHNTTQHNTTQHNRTHIAQVRGGIVRCGANRIESNRIEREIDEPLCALHFPWGCDYARYYETKRGYKPHVTSRDASCRVVTCRAVPCRDVVWRAHLAYSCSVQ
mmetsp:Transcript_11651/g.24608  ORF Transcript_11651/g.24608 Transcript_11651/m.24608 type:complete len:283 (+) Transcript_11651:487-1335(+)